MPQPILWLNRNSALYFSYPPSSLGEGVIGEDLAKICEETKRRPRYLIKNEIRDDRS